MYISASMMELQTNKLKWLVVTSSIFVLLLVPALGQNEKMMFCYYGSESQYRNYPGKFMPSNIDPSLCTHIIFAFADVEGTHLFAQNWNDLGDNGLYAQTVALKSRNPSLKVLLAVGGWVAGYRPFRYVVATDQNMEGFARNAARYIRAAGMDGLDMDWEFPGTRESPPEDKYKFTKLMQILRSTFEKEAEDTKRERLLITLATAVGSEFIAMSYESAKVHRYVDYMLLMTYNFHGGWDNVTGHPSSILPSNFDEGIKRELCQTWAVNYWLSVGVPKSKAVLGMATYGMSFTLKNASNNGLNASVYGDGDPGRYTRQKGILAYYEICENIQRNGWRKVWLDDQEVPYAVWRDQWVGYDDARSVRIKAEKVINGLDLAGAFVWAIELDDFNNHCGGGRYPLLNAIKDAIRRPVTKVPNDELPLPVPQYPSADCARKNTGIHGDPNNCRWFWYCIREPTSNEFIKFTYSCPTGLAYDNYTNSCDLSPTCL